MRILIAGQDDRLIEAIKGERSDDECTTFEPENLTDDTAVWEAVREVDAVVHLGELVGEDEHRQMDLATRGTYMLVKAAVDAGVRRIVLGSTLAFFRAYPDDVYITPYWRPEPTDDFDQLLPLLSEVAAREFARDHAVAVTVVRLGHLVDVDSVEGEPQTDWLDYRDAAKAIGLAVDRDTSDELNWQQRYGILHVVGDHPNPRFLKGDPRIAGLRPMLEIERRNFGGAS